MEKIQNLTGHSGCSISIYKDGLNFFIRKKVELLIIIIDCGSSV